MTAPSSVSQTTALCHAAEDAGFRSLWLYDGPRNAEDPFGLLTQIASVTRRLHVGVCVTNPVSRAPSSIALAFAALQNMSGGRAELGIGRGDAAVVGTGHGPATLDELRDAVSEIRSVARGAYDAPRFVRDVPIWIAAFGPRALKLAGAVGDGVILQYTDVELLTWAISRVRDGARAAGRDPHEVRVMAASAFAIDTSRDEACAQVRWFVSLMARDLAQVVSANPSAFSEPFSTWGTRWRQADDARRAALADELAPRLALIGSADKCRAHLKSMAEVGVEEMNFFSLGNEFVAVHKAQSIMIP